MIQKLGAKLRQVWRVSSRFAERNVSDGSKTCDLLRGQHFCINSNNRLPDGFDTALFDYFLPNY